VIHPKLADPFANGPCVTCIPEGETVKPRGNQGANPDILEPKPPVAEGLGL